MRAQWHSFAVGMALVLALSGPSMAAAAEVRRVDATQLEALMAAGVPVVDIRRADEWRATGVVEGSTLITAFDGEGQLDAGFIEKVRAAVGDDKPLALICRSGNRSAAAARLLAASGTSATIYDIAGGVRDWAATGHALTPCPQC